MKNFRALRLAFILCSGLFSLPAHASSNYVAEEVIYTGYATLPNYYSCGSPSAPASVGAISGCLSTHFGTATWKNYYENTTYQPYTYALIKSPPDFGYFEYRTTNSLGGVSSASATFYLVNSSSNCPANSTGSPCLCSAPYIANADHTACITPPATCTQAAGTGQSDFIFSGYSATMPDGFCYGSCLMHSTSGSALNGMDWVVRAASTGSACQVETSGVERADSQSTFTDPVLTSPDSASSIPANGTMSTISSGTSTTATTETGTTSAPAADGSTTSASSSVSSTTTSSTSTSTLDITLDLSPVVAAVNSSTLAIVDAENLTTLAVKDNTLALKGSPTASQTAALNTSLDANAFNSAIATNFNALNIATDKNTFNALWQWTPPGYQACLPYAGTVHGYAISWDMCPTIANINLVLGWLFAIFGLFTVYSTFTTVKS
jgi:hypothetical protein